MIPVCISTVPSCVDHEVDFVSFLVPYPTQSPFLSCYIYILPITYRSSIPIPCLGRVLYHIFIFYTLTK